MYSRGKPMSNNKHEIDFTELESTVRGEGLEGLARMLGRSLGLNPVSTGRGTDQGKDLEFTEILRGPLINNSIKWLVSCKDNGASGKSVSENDLPNNIELKLTQHSATGFLLVTTTVASTGAKALLDAIDVRNGGKYHTLVWDETELRAMLLTPENEAILKQFLPKSYKRVLSMGTLQGALEAYRSELPTPLYNTLRGLIAPFQDKVLLGITIWPHDVETAATIDTVIHAVVSTRKIEEAVSLSQSLGLDALVATLAALYKKNNGAAFDFALQLIRKSESIEKIATVGQFLADYHELESEDCYVLINRLGFSGGAWIIDQNIRLFVANSILYGLGCANLRENLNGAYAEYFVSEVNVTGYSLIAVEDVQPVHYKCECRFQMDILVDTLKAGDPTGFTTVSIPGKLELTIEPTGFCFDCATIDTAVAIEADLFKGEANV